MPDTLNIAVLASGRGSNFQAILSAIGNGSIPNAKIVVAISNNADSGALATAREHTITAIHLSRKQFTSDADFTEAMLKTLERYGTNFIVLAGYMKKVDRAIIQKYRNRVLNIHPALLPKFGGIGMYGIHVHEAVLKSNEPMSGATVHLVDEEYDRGPIILQKSIAVSPGDTPETLAEKILRIEHEIYPMAIRLFAEGKVTIDGSHVAVVTS